MIQKLEKHNDYVYDIQLDRNHYFPANNIYTHNCRLRNSVEDQLKEFSYTLGAGGVATGSINVITLNLNRIAQSGLSLKSVLEKVYKFQVAFRKIFEDFNNKNMLPAYKAHFISMNKQFSTIGINGLVESAEFYGLNVSLNKEYEEYIDRVLSIISSMNKEARKKYGCKFNTEMVPAENLGVKQAKWESKIYVDLFEVEDENGNINKYALNTKCYMKDGSYKLIQDLTEDDYQNIEKIDKYSSLLD